MLLNIPTKSPLILHESPVGLIPRPGITFFFEQGTRRQVRQGNQAAGAWTGERVAERRDR